MWRIVRHAVLGLLGWAGMLVSALADETAAWGALRQGDHVALMRHAKAPRGAGEPPGFRLDDCSTQRNLSPKGRADAQAVGQRLRAKGVAKLLSSPWCRCVDTARLLGLGPVDIEPTFGNAFVLADQRSVLTAGAKAIIARWQGPETLLVVTHGANIQALTGVNPASGEIVVVAAAPDGAIREIGRLPSLDRRTTGQPCLKYPLITPGAERFNTVGELCDVLRVTETKLKRSPHAIGRSDCGRLIRAAEHPHP